MNIAHITMLVEHHLEDTDELGEAARALYEELKPALNLREAIERYASAMVDDSWKGGDDPATWDDVDRELHLAKEHLDKTILAVTTPQT